jgi:two-component system, sensor histidine kinase
LLILFGGPSGPPFFVKFCRGQGIPTKKYGLGRFLPQPALAIPAWDDIVPGTPTSMPVTVPPGTPIATGAAVNTVGERHQFVQTRVRIELVRMAFAELNGATLASAGVAAAFGIMLAVHAPSTTLWGWLAGLTAVLAYRFWLALGFRRTNPAPEHLSRWAARLITATTLTGLGWGVSTWLFPTLPPGNALGVVHVFMLAGLTTGSTRLLLTMRKGSLAYLLAINIPLALRLFANADVAGILLGACVVIFSLYMSSAMRRNHQIVSDALAMRFEREAIAAELQEENTRRESRESELREAREHAESASRAKGEFLATISHEIRTPMNGVLGMLRVVRDTPLSPEQRNYLKTASDSAEALLLLLNDVLDFSKIEAGRLDLERAPYPPATAARAVTDLMHARARDKGLQFELRLAENLPGVILGDATRLRQILVNLIGNAIKFTERGRVELAVDCVERTSSRAVMHFTVTDTGIGIDSAALEKLFKPFTQADASMSRRYGGTGLGLAISQRLAQAMGGALQVQSTLNQGTVFRLIVPCDLPDVSAPLRATEPPRFVLPSLQGRVLVVEDDSVNQQVIELFLKKLNVTPSFASDGESAITTAMSEPFDLVLMDCQLPGIDGIETTRRIRKQLAGRPLKIIALTANASTDMREACIAAGMDDFLSKPVRFELLAGLLQRNLSEQPAAEHPAART